MINLIRNEFIKINKFKLLFPFILFLSVIIIEYYFNKQITFENIVTLIPYIGIFLVIIFSGIVSTEIDSGTFKYYLTKSKTRTKVLISKILMSYIYIFLLILFIFLIFYFFSKECNIKFFLYTIPLYFIVSFTIFLSILIKNTPINSGICIILLTFSGILSEFLFKNGIKFFQYTIFPYLDLSIFLSRESIEFVNLEYGINLNINYGIFINMVFILLFNIFSYLITHII